MVEPNCVSFVNRQYDTLTGCDERCLHYRVQYRKAAQSAYQTKMIAAHTGKGDFPRIRTFNKTENSTNSVFRDLEAAEKL